MAWLQLHNTSTPIYLAAFHRFGRLEGTVETLLDGRQISRIHGIIEWHANQWFIRDLSKNGIWLNNQSIQRKQLISLKKHDVISFSPSHEHQYTIMDIGEPQDLLIPLVASAEHQPIVLEPYNILPNEDDGELLVFYDTASKHWLIESQLDGETTRLQHGQCIVFAQQQWRFQALGEMVHEKTIDIRQGSDPIVVNFYLSQDEELVEVVAENSNIQINLETRSHHYLTALLARYKYADRQKQHSAALQGWVSLEVLKRDLGYSETHINIQIHRARKQFAKQLLANNLTSDLLIERKRGQVRLGIDYFKVYKGQVLEADYMGVSMEVSI